eukprot:gene22292-16723_t
MRPTSSFIGKIKDKDGNTVGVGEAALALSPSSEHRSSAAATATAAAAAHVHVAAVSPVSPRRGSPSPSPPKRTSSQRDVLRSSTGGESIGSGGRDGDLSPTRRGVWVPAATAGATALLHPRLSRLSSAASAASFHLPTKSSLSKSAFVENMHLSR